MCNKMDVKKNELINMPFLIKEAIKNVVGSRIFLIIAEEHDNLKIEYENACKKNLIHEKSHSEM